MILRVKKRGDGRSASPTIRFEGKRPLVKGAPGSFLGGAPALWLRVPGAEAPPAWFNVQEERGNASMSATLRARVIGGGGMVCGVFGWWEVGGGGR